MYCTLYMSFEVHPWVEWFRYFDHYLFRPPHKYIVGPSLFVLIDNLTTLVCLTHTTFNSATSSESVLVRTGPLKLDSANGLTKVLSHFCEHWVSLRYFFREKKWLVWQKVRFLFNRYIQNKKLLENLDKSPAPQLAKFAVCTEQKGDSNWNLKSW